MFFKRIQPTKQQIKNRTRIRLTHHQKGLIDETIKLHKVKKAYLRHQKAINKIDGKGFTKAQEDAFLKGFNSNDFNGMYKPNK